jgi:transposase InsO family protein
VKAAGDGREQRLELGVGLPQRVDHDPDNGVIESFWWRVQVKLLNRRKWKTQIGLANAISEHLEIFHNRQWRHRSLRIRTPIEYKNLDRLTGA